MRSLKSVTKHISELLKFLVRNEPVFEQVHTHTPRRTGATLMYLSGMDVYDIIKIIGHALSAILKKYIRADELTGNRRPNCRKAFRHYQEPHLTRVPWSETVNDTEKAFSIAKKFRRISSYHYER